MTDDVRRARVARDMEELFLPIYDATNMPSADKRAAYALEHIAFRLGRIDQALDRLASALAELTATRTPS
jgi:hypothetical protein